MERVEIICTVIGAVAVVLSGIWFIINQIIKLGNRLVRIDYRLDSMEKTLNGLPCSSHSADLTKVKAIIIQKFPSIAISFSLKASPRQLNPIGLQIFNEVNGDEFLNENKAILFKYIDEHNPLTKLDVEQYANDSFLPLIDTSIFNKLKDYVYERSSFTLENGEKYTLDVIDLCFILSLPLRDMYLKENEFTNN
jgi:hypothetical protein